MKKAIIITTVVCSILIILDTVNAADSLILFLFAGVIPGTSIRVSAIDMMAATATAITIVIMRLTLWPTLRSTIFAPATSHQSHTRTKRSTRPLL